MPQFGQLPPGQAGLPPRIDMQYVNWPVMQQAIGQMPAGELESLLQTLGGERPPLPQPDPAMEEQLRIAQMNRAAMQTQQGQGGLGAAGPPMPIGMTPQNAPLPQLGPFVPRPIPAEDPTGQLLYQAQPDRTQTYLEGVREAADVPFTPRMAAALAGMPSTPEYKPLAPRPGTLAARHSAKKGKSFADWTQAMITRREDAMAGQLPNVVGPWVGDVEDRFPSTYSRLSDEMKTAMRGRTTARREKVELARGARREGMTPSQFKAVQSVRDDPDVMRQRALGAGLITAMAGQDEQDRLSDPAYQLRVALTSYLQSAAAAGVAPDPDTVKSFWDRIDAIGEPSIPPPPPGGGLPPGTATPPIPSGPTAGPPPIPGAPVRPNIVPATPPFVNDPNGDAAVAARNNRAAGPAVFLPNIPPVSGPVQNLTDEERRFIALRVDDKETFIKEYAKALELRGMDSLKANELARKAHKKHHEPLSRSNPNL